MTVSLTGSGLSRSEVVSVARAGAPVSLSPDATARIERSAAVVARLAESEEPVYGVSTGFGSLATTPIPPQRRGAASALARSLARCRHGAAGRARGGARDDAAPGTLAGDGLQRRAARSSSSGLLDLLNAGITPVVPEHGSLGASGDLAPLAHSALALIGEGEAFAADGSRVPGAEALAAAGLEPLELTAKEGLALINGTDGILGILILASHDLERLAARRRRSPRR